MDERPDPRNRPKPNAPSASDDGRHAGFKQQVFDDKNAREVRDTAKTRAPRPKPAGTLILTRRRQGTFDMLMGRRVNTHTFMPGKYVFPGGRVDRADYRAAAPSQLKPHIEARLEAQDALSLGRAQAMASVRETFEEVGITLGRPFERTPRTKSPAWQAFYAGGLGPALADLHLVARAITPPYRPKRFDARFFLAEAEDFLTSDGLDGEHSGELADIGWFTPEAANGLDLPIITRLVIEEVAERMAGKKSLEAKGPFVYFSAGKPVVDEA
ncbi:MAG: NUDIX hydrolase [Pseudomonadota bacterium]